MIEVESVQHSNIDESEMGQLHAIHINENAIAAVRQRIATGQSLLNCVDCGEIIPLARRSAVQGCLRCISCQIAYEHH